MLQLAAADAQIEAQRKEFDARRLEDMDQTLPEANSSALNSTTDGEVSLCLVRTCKGYSRFLEDLLPSSC